MTRQCSAGVKRMSFEINRFNVNPNATLLAVRSLSKIINFKMSVITPVV